MPNLSNLSTRTRWGLAATAALVVATTVLLVLFQWNWLRGPVAGVLSARIHRAVAITGDLEVHPWSWSPTAEINGLVIGNAPGAGPAPLAIVPRLVVQARLASLLSGRPDLLRVEADQPSVHLSLDSRGLGNWVFDPLHPIPPPPMDRLVIKDGAIRYDDPGGRLTFAGQFSSNEGAAGPGSGAFTLEGQGTRNGRPFTACVSGGPLIHLDPRRPYRFDAGLAAGSTRVRLSGRFDHPFNLAALSGRFFVKGPDLADLYHITGLALPSTPPYDLAADFARRGARVSLTSIQGRVGDSDLAGSMSVDTVAGRPFVKADLASRRLRIADLAAMIGAAPRKTAGHTLSPAQLAMAAKLKAQHRLLPDAHLDVGRVRGMDAQVTYRAESVEAGPAPIKALRLNVTLDHGLLTADPLDVTLPQGRLAGKIAIDARGPVPREAVDLSLTNGRLESLSGPQVANPPLEGGLYARVKLSGSGDSVRAAAGGASGAVSLVVPSGEMRQAFAEAMGVNVSKALLLFIAKDQRETPIRCGVVDLQAQGGVMTARRIVLDTAVVQVVGRGQIDMRRETLDLSLAGKPKQFRLIRLGAPITVKGSWVAPKIGVDIAKAAPQALLSIAVGVFAAPAAAVLPFVNPGLAKNADCAAVMASYGSVGPPGRSKGMTTSASRGLAK